MTQASKEAFINHLSQMETNKEKITAVLERYPDITRFAVGRLTGIGHLEAQRRLSDLKNENKVYESGTRKHGINRVSTYSLVRQLSWVNSARIPCSKWLKQKYPNIWHEYNMLQNQNL
jgi:hypothetical protein